MMFCFRHFYFRRFSLSTFFPSAFLRYTEKIGSNRLDEIEEWLEKGRKEKYRKGKMPKIKMSKMKTMQMSLDRNGE